MSRPFEEAMWMANKYMKQYSTSAIKGLRIKVKLLSRVWLFATPWTVASQASLFMGFSRQEYWNGLPFPSPWNLPDPGIEPRSLLPVQMVQVQSLVRELRSHMPCGIAKKLIENIKCCQLFRKKAWIYYTLQWEYRMVPPLWKTVWQLIKNLNIEKNI